MNQIDRHDQPVLNTPATPSSNPAQPANEDNPAAGELYRLINRKPKHTVFYMAGVATVFILATAAAYLWGLYGDTVLERPATTWMPVLIAAIVPTLLIWALAYMSWRTQHLHMMSDALARTALRLTEPEELAEERISAMASTIRTQLEKMNTGLQEVFTQTQTLDDMFSERLDSVDRSALRAELRAREIGDALTRNRATIDEISGKLGQESDTISRAVRTQTDEVRSVTRKAEEVMNANLERLRKQTETLSRITETAAAGADNTTVMLDRQSSRLEVVANAALNKADALSQRYENQRENLVAASQSLETERLHLETTFERQRATIETTSAELAARTADINASVSTLSTELGHAMDAAAKRTNELGKTFQSEAQRMGLAAKDAGINIEDSLRSASDRVKSVSNELKANAADITKQSEKAAREMGELTGKTQVEITHLADTVRKESEAIEGNIRHATGALKATFTSETELFNTAINQQTSTLASMLRDQMDLLAKDLTTSSEEINLAVLQAADAIQAEVTHRTDDIRGTVQSTSSDLEGVGEKLNNVMFRIGGAARDATRTLQSASEDLETRMQTLPNEAAEGAQALQTVLEEQITTLASIAEIVVRHSRTFDKNAPNAPLAPSLENAARTYVPAAPQMAAPRTSVARPPQMPTETKSKKAGGKWALSDLLTAARKSEGPATEKPLDEQEFNRTALHIIETLQSLAVDLDRALEQSPPAELWQRYQQGERNVFARRLYNLQGRELYDTIAERFSREPEFRDDVQRFIRLFEKLMLHASERDRDNILVETYLTSDTGKVYLMLAQASGHLS